MLQEVQIVVNARPASMVASMLLFEGYGGLGCVPVARRSWTRLPS